MQFSNQLDSMHNSPLKCSTNEASPDKAQHKAYQNSDEKPATRVSPSPTKPSMTRLKSFHNSASPAKPSTLSGENVRVEDPSYKSPPSKKYGSPQRTSGQKRLSPSKNSAPFGKPIEIIKSK